MEQNIESSPKQTVIIINQKSKAVGILLALFFGPLGLLYSSFSSALIMGLVYPLVGALLVVSFTYLQAPPLIVLSIGILAAISYLPICAFLAYRTIRRKNASQMKEVIESLNTLDKKEQGVDLIGTVLMILFLICFFYAVLNILISALRP